MAKTKLQVLPNQNNNSHDIQKNEKVTESKSGSLPSLSEVSKLFKEFWVGFDVGSDHYPVHALFQFKSPVSANPLKVRKLC